MATRNERKNLVVNTIVIKPNNRNVLDVGQWRAALKQADRGKRAKLYDLYDDILLDPVLGSAMEKRIMAITNAELVFKTKNEQSIPELDDLIDSPAFEYLLKEVMTSIFYGKSVIELDFSNGFEAYSIPRQHINTANGVITVNPGDTNGIPYTNDDFLLDVGRNDNLGLLLRAAPLAIYKRGGFGDWSQFVELFGMPRRIGKYNSYDQESRKVLEEALEAAGSASWMVVPKETDVETQETSATQGSSSIYNEFRQACNEEILITILGQTMTTQNGSSRSQSETHKEVEESINKSDRRFVQRVLNTLLLPRLAKRGYPVEGGYFYFPEAGESLSLKDQLDMDVKLVNELGVALDEDYFYETYGRPKPKNSAAKSPGNTSEQREQTWFDRLASFFVGAPEEGAIRYQATCSGCNGTHHFDLADNLPEFDTDKLLERIAAGNASYFDPELFNYTSGALLNALRAGFLAKNFDFEYGFEPDALKTAMEINLFHFSAAKTLTEVQKLNELWRQSTSFNDFKAKAESVTQVFNQNWLRTEYDTAYHVAENSATFYRMKAQANIFPFWEYRTIGDEKVREEHRALNGIVLPQNDKRWNKIYPPNGWNCRCYVVPRMAHEVDKSKINKGEATVDDYIRSPEWIKNEAQGFGVNRALTGEVFRANQMYIKKFPNKAAKLLGNLFYNDWGLNGIEKEIQSATEAATPYTGTAEQWYTSNFKNKVAKFSDYQNRTIWLSEKVFKTHTTAKYADRVQYLELLNDIIANPDEVWINNYLGADFDNLVMIRYYKDNAIAAVSRVEDGKVMLKTWFKIAIQSVIKDKLKNPRWAYRRGLLIKHKR